MKYRQLTSEERYRISALRQAGSCPAAIARRLRRHRSTISRELQRNGSPWDGSYRPSKAQEQANREIPMARGVATQSISEAEGYALERVNRAEGEATRFEAILGEYQGAPQVTRRRLYLEAMTGLLADMKGLYIVDRDQQAMVPWLPMESSQQPSAEGRKP